MTFWPVCAFQMDGKQMALQESADHLRSYELKMWGGLFDIYVIVTELKRLRALGKLQSRRC